MWRALMTALAVLTLSHDSVMAQNSAPGRDNVLIWGPVAGHIAATDVWMRTAAMNGDYRIDIAVDPTDNSVSAVTIPTLDALLRDGYGILYFETHGSGSVLMGEGFLTQTDREAVLQSYWNSGYAATELTRANFINPNTGQVEQWGIGLTADFFTGRYTDEETFVCVVACTSWAFRNAFTTYRAYASFNHSFTYVEANPIIRSVFEGLMGWRNYDKRTLAAAVAGTPMRYAGTGTTVLNPTVAATDLVRDVTITAPKTGYVKFDCPMYTAIPATDIVQARGALEITNAYWQGNDQIAFNYKGRWRGRGAIEIKTDTSSRIFGGAVSFPGYIHLVGNTYGTDPGVNGHAPCGNYEVKMLSEMGGDNPAASLAAFSAVRQPNGTTVEWRVEAEHGTARWRLERADGAGLPFIVVHDIPATGQPSYTYHDPDGSPASFYRLVEVEVGGRELVQASEGVVEDVTVIPDPVISETTGRAITDSLLLNYPTVIPPVPQDAQPIHAWLALLPNESWRTAIQPLVNFHQSRGLPAHAVTLDEIGGVAGVRTYVQWAASHGLRYLVLCGDASNWQWHNTPATYGTQWAMFSYGAQQSYDIIPMAQYRLDPVGIQALSLTWFTPEYATDWPYGDVDGDMLPDVAVGRLPAHSAGELAAMVAKQLAFATQPILPPRLLALGEFRNLSGNNGAFGWLLSDSLTRSFPSHWTVQKLYHSDQAPMTYPTREALAIQGCNLNPTVIQLFSTQSNRSKWALWLNKTDGFSWTKLDTSSTFPFVLGVSCDVADIDRAEDPAFGRPLAELAMLEPQRGPAIIAGPTRGSWQHDDYQIGALAMDFVFRRGITSIGEAFMLAVREYGQRGTELRHQALSQAFLGDPAMTLPGMSFRVADASDAGSRNRMELAVGMNPCRGATTIRFDLASSRAVTLAVYDLRGRLVETVTHGRFPAGQHTVRWTAPAQPGVYFLALSDESQTRTQKIVVLR